MCRHFPYKLFELDSEHKAMLGTDKKYFLTNGVIGLFGNNRKELIISMNVLLNR